MGFLTRLLAGLTAAAALGAGLAGTANAVDVTGAAGTTKSVVKLTADDTNNLPDHIVNGSFDYPSVPSWTGLAGSSSNKFNKGKRFAAINPGTGKYGSGCAMSTTGRAISNWNRSSFAWSSTQGDTHYSGGMSCEAGNVELNYDSVHHNQFAELTADQQGTAIYQDVKVTPGTMMKWSLKHSSATSAYVDKMQVMIGEPYKETVQEVTRIASENGNKVGEKMTTISTPTTSDRADNKKWDTYSGAYLVPDGVTTVRFTFKSVASAEWYSGNDLDDIEFSRSYKLTYDKNSSDAAGEVPSNQRGRENTVQPAESKTNGTVKTVADDTSNLPDHLVNGDFEYPGANVLNEKGNWWGVSRKDRMVFAPQPRWVSLPSTFDPDKFAWDSTEVARVQNESSQWHTNEVELQRDSRTGNMYAELCAYQAHTSIRQYIHTTPGTLYKVRLKHASLSRDYLDKMQVLVGPAGNEQPVRMTRVESQNRLDATGESTASTTVSTHASNEMEIKDDQGPFSSRNHNGQWATYEGVYVATSDVTSFTFKSVDSKTYNLGNLLDDIVFDKAYRLSYNKNSTAASGQVPSNQRGKENTVQPAKARATGTVKTVADDDSSKSLTVNPGFNVPDYSKLDDGGLHWMYVNPAEGKAWSYYDYINPAPSEHQVAGLSQATFGWQELTGGDHKTTAFELHREKDGNVCADVHGSRTIGQTIDTQAGVAYTVSIRHSGRSKGNAGSVQVLVGPDKDHLRPLEMSRMNVSRTGAKYGDRIGKVGTVITTHSDSVDSTEGDHPAWDHSDDWETYSGTYVATGGKTVFAYRGVDENGDSVSGNDPVADSVIDDLSFKLAYRLSYDKNAADAAGSIPSDEYGKENTVRQAKSKANGSVKLVADDDVAEYAANGLPKQLVNSDFDHDWRNIVSQSKMSAKYNFANIDPAHGDVEISGALNGKGEASKQWVHLNGFDAAKFGWKSNQTDTRVDGRGGIVEIQRSRANDNMYAEITASQANTYLYQDIDTAHSTPTVYTVKLRYAHRNGTINSNEKIQILVGAPGHEQPVEMTRIASDRGNRLGEKSTTVNAPNTDGWLGSWDTFQGSVVVPAGQNVSRFTFKALGSIDGISGNLIDDVQFKLAYKLSYDKNAQDATGSIPSGAAANTTRPAKSETDGKVSDLVQRTTTHEDGSVTVRTIDTSTDVVSGCQVYYPAGQKITLATMAKDDDCWDSSMLSRPGHTQLGWNQDRNATQAQAQVTMVEGGMTVYAVWVGNPVLTYDTNKPNTWTGQMPSTPASVSVPYNTAAADGSGWRAGDTTKIRGYRFLGWYTGPQDNAGLYDWTRPLTGNVTVYAHWQRLQANVIYNANGGTGSHPNTTGWQYSDVTIPGDTSKSFKRDKYVFKGWGTKPGKADVVYKGGSKVALQDKDITLYAQWQEVHENFVETGGIGLPIAIAGGVLLLMFGIGSTVMLTRRMNGHGMPDAE